MPIPTTPAPAVSVIILSYNRAHYLPGAIESVLNQTFRDFEIIIVDDGSQDNAPEIGQSYAARYDNVSFISQKNAGISAAIKTGVDNARGELIAFLANDDLDHPEKLEHQVTLMQERDDIDACTTNYAYIGEKECAPIGKREGASRRKRYLWRGKGLMIRRATYQALGGCLEYFRLVDDTAIFLLFNVHHHYEYINKVLRYYRKPQKGGDNLSLVTKEQPLENLFYRTAAFVNSHCRRHGRPNPLETGETMESILRRSFDPFETGETIEPILCEASNLPVEERLFLLRAVRNAARYTLVIKENPYDDMIRINQYMEFLGKEECQKKAKRYRFRLFFRLLIHRQIKSAYLFNPFKLF